MAVKLGHARGDEKGGAKGGQAGDQTGREVSVSNWYRHNKIWRVFRAKNPAQAAMIAQDCEWACANDHIGYDQGERLTLYKAAQAVDFNCSRVDVDCETDCSALVRVCCAYARIMLPNFNTSTEPKILLNSGEFVELVGPKYSDSSDHLRRGDILCTSVQGHTAIVLTDGAKADEDATPGEIHLGDRVLKNGDVGEDVREMQVGLIALGYDCGKWGADGDFGDATEIAVKEFQKDHPPLAVDGEFGPKSLAALEKALNDSDKEPDSPRYVVIEGGNCYVRSAPSTDGKILGVAARGSKWPYQGETSPAGWLLIEYGVQNGWVSGKYGRLCK